MAKCDLCFEAFDILTDCEICKDGYCGSCGNSCYECGLNQCNTCEDFHDCKQTVLEL